MRIVLDAAAALDLAFEGRTARWRPLIGAVERGTAELVGPRLLWDEALDVVRRLAFGGQLSDDEARDTRRLLADAPIAPLDPPGLAEAAWDVAARLGWARTLDATYCALAELVDGALVTTDAHLLAHATGRLRVPVVDPPALAAALRA